MAARHAAVRVVHDTTVVHDTLIVRDTVTVHHAVAVHDTVREAAASVPQSPMTLDGVLTLLGLLLAIYALAGPAQRRSLSILLPLKRLLVGLNFAVFLVLVPDLVRLVGFEPPRLVALGAPIVAFVLAIGVIIFGIVTWARGAIPPGALGTLEKLALVSLNEGNFDEVGRLLRRNVIAIREAPEDSLVALFDPKLVEAMVTRRNYAHLELLGDTSAFGKRRAALTGVDIVSHALLRADPSPVTSVIVRTLGGDERHAAITSEETLARRTYGNWRWYTASRAAQIITVVGYEALMTGRFDVVYNAADFHYQTRNGTSGRIKCPAYRAIALHYLALEQAQRYGIIDGADPNDFFSVFKAAFARSRITRAWDDAMRDAPTPFSYLMQEIMGFLRSLARDGYEHALHDTRFRDEVGNDIPVPPGAQAVFRRTCENWALCAWLMTTEDGHVPDKFVVTAIREYLNEVLQFGFEHGTSPERSDYAQVAADCLRRHVHEVRLSKLVRDAFESLDHGKRYVQDGQGWLGSALGLGDARS